AGVAGHPYDVPARAREARDEPGANRIANANHDDGDRVGGVLGCRHSLRPQRYDDVHLEPDELGRQVGQPVDPILRISIVDDNILAFNPPELAQPLPERVEQGRSIGRGRHTKKTYPRHLSRLLGGQRALGLHAPSELLVEPLNRVRGSYRFPLRFGVAKEREELVAAFSQTRYDARTALVPCALEGRVGGAGGVGIRRVDDAMEVVTDFRQRVLRSEEHTSELQSR